MKRVSLGMLGLLLLASCQSETFEQRVARLRAGYTITSGGFVVEQTPEPTAPGAAAIEGTAAGGEDVAAGAQAAAEEATASEAPADEASPGAAGIEVEDLMPVRQDVLLDLLIRNDNVRGSLPGLTLDITQVDSTGAEKDHWRAWIDTSGIGRGPGRQLTHELEDVEFEEGDTFEVQVRSPVPAAQRGDYAEFTPTGG